MPSSAVMQKAAIFFLKNCPPLYAYLYQKIPYKLSIYLIEQEGQSLEAAYDQRAMNLLLPCRNLRQGKGPVGVDIAIELEGLQALDCAGIDC